MEILLVSSFLYSSFIFSSLLSSLFLSFSLLLTHFTTNTTITTTIATTITTTTTLQKNSELLTKVRELEERAWRLEGEARRAESLAGLRDPRTCRRKASRDQLVQTVSKQADTIAKLQLQLKEAYEVRLADGMHGY